VGCKKSEILIKKSLFFYCPYFSSFIANHAKPLSKKMLFLEKNIIFAAKKFCNEKN